MEPQRAECLIQQARDGFRTETFTLMLPRQRKLDLSPVGFVLVDPQGAIPDERSRLFRFDGELEPLARHARSRRPPSRMKAVASCSSQESQAWYRATSGSLR
jgi:hypothetical protein